jgi:hypothetical protein
MKVDFNINFDDVVQEPVLYGDFVAQTADKAYQELDDLPLVKIKYCLKLNQFFNFV